jgi:uncharacterized 2Fe-2S/4Fe-4S cluster protein (DUF4445 family)
MSFTLEFEPLGIRLLCEEPLTLLQAARQAGIHLRSECGGKGTCTKCQVQILKGAVPPLTELERNTFTAAQIDLGFRLACRTIVTSDAEIYLPAQSLLSDQVLQTEGSSQEFSPDPAVKMIPITLTPPSFTDLQPDWERVQAVLSQKGIGRLSASVPVLTSISTQLRKSDWKINLIHNEKEILNACSPEIFTPIGLAVDVGSTKVACFLMDLYTGQTLAARGIANPQIAFGEDIMSRLAAVLENPHNASALKQGVMQTIQSAVAEMCAKLGVPMEHVVDACLVGNTAMHHLFLGLPTLALAMSPFVPVTGAELYPYTHELGLQLMPGARVYIPPVIAGFVGSDHLAFLLASGFGDDQRSRLGIDIGTNTEIALQHAGRIVSISTASGPAFEGAHIRFGMRAAPGAIEHVMIDEKGVAHCQVIGSQPASGICGSGILDAVAELRRTQLINPRGRLEKSSPMIRSNTEGKPIFILVPEGANQREISMDQKDIDQILLAKGAIRAGIDILLDYLNVQLNQIDEIVIAGAFGSYMNPEQAMRIGLLPDVPLQRIHAVGNAAGVGARMLLASTKMRLKALALVQKIEYLELTIYPDFNLFFANGIKF